MDTSDDQTTADESGSGFHRIKGKVKKVLGAATADRQAEAEGAAEERLGAVPPEAEVQQEKRAVKDGYDETPEATPRPPAPPAVQEDR